MNAASSFVIYMQCSIITTFEIFTRIIIYFNQYTRYDQCLSVVMIKNNCIFQVFFLNRKTIAFIEVKSQFWFYFVLQILHGWLLRHRSAQRAPCLTSSGTRRSCSIQWNTIWAGLTTRPPGNSKLKYPGLTSSFSTS